MLKTLPLLIKPASGHCNMRCAYCFYADVTAAHPGGNRGIMSLETLERVVASALGETERLCSFVFQGGEPLLAGLDFFRAFIELEKKYNRRGIRVDHAIQTNGLLLDEEWAAFLAEYKFLVGLSIDGETSVHDAL